MSLEITLLAVVLAIASAALTLRVAPRLGADNASWGVLFGFLAGVVAAGIVDFPNLSSDTATISALITALVATPVITVIVFFGRRAVSLLRRRSWS